MSTIKLYSLVMADKIIRYFVDDDGAIDGDTIPGASGPRYRRANFVYIEPDFVKVGLSPESTRMIPTGKLDDIYVHRLDA